LGRIVLELLSSAKPGTISRQDSNKTTRMCSLTFFASLNLV
jgi:hypothetical protein